MVAVEGCSLVEGIGLVEGTGDNVADLADLSSRMVFAMWEVRWVFEMGMPSGCMDHPPGLEECMERAGEQALDDEGLAGVNSVGSSGGMS